MSNVKKNSQILFGFLSIVLAVFILFMIKNVSAWEDPTNQTGNSNQICVDGRLLEVTASRTAYQSQLQAKAGYIDSSDLVALCIQEYVFDENGDLVLDRRGNPQKQCMTYDGTEIPITFTYTDITTQTGVSCKAESSSKFDENYHLKDSVSYSWKSCPVIGSNLEGILTDMDKWGPTNIASSITKEFNFSTQRWKITLSNLENVDVVLVGGTADAAGNTTFTNAEGTPNSTRLYLNSTPQSGYGYYNASVVYTGNTGVLTFEVTPGSEYYFQLNIRTGDCSGSEVAHSNGATSSVIPNDVLKNSSTCTDYTAQALAFNQTLITNLYKSLVPECYDDSDIDYIKLANGDYTTKVNNALRTLTTINESLKNSSGNSVNTDPLQCDFDASHNTHQYVYTEKLSKSLGTGTSGSINSSTGGTGSFGTYWDAICTETIVVNFDTPKALDYAGKPFEYNSTISVVRECTPIQLKEPEYKPMCSYSVECWGGPPNHTGGAIAGPNEEFDECVQQCDGGSYTQSCINSCYNSVYENNSTDSVITSFNFFADNYLNVEQTAYSDFDFSNNVGENCTRGTYNSLAKLPMSSCHVDVGNRTASSANQNCGKDYCISEHGIRYMYLDTCNGNGTVSGVACYEVFRSSTSCIDAYLGDDNRWYLDKERTNLYTEQASIDDYEKQIQDSKKEYEALVRAMQYFQDNESDISLAIIDSYTGETHTKDEYNPVILYQAEDGTTLLTNSEFKSQYDRDGSQGFSIKGADQQVTFDDKRQTTKGFTINNYTTTKTYEIILPEAYVSNVNIGDYKYGLTTDEEKKGYSNGGNMYYTHIFSPGINDVLVWPDYVSVDDLKTEHNITNNIQVLYTIGTWNQVSDAIINCFYGIPDNSTPIEEPDVNCTGENCYEPACGPNDICEPGLIYIWRTIDLYDMFPSNSTIASSTSVRQPRWNWSSAAIDVTNQRYPINPTKVIENVEKAGDTIYGNDEELDYQIFLSQSSIKQIREYNKTHGAYTDFEDMRCEYKDDVSVCYSYLLDHASEYGIELRKRGKAGCNNQRGTGSESQCIDPEYTITNGG